jgi:hypothetical protein
VAFNINNQQVISEEQKRLYENKLLLRIRRPLQESKKAETAETKRSKSSFKVNKMKLEIE